MEVEVEGEGECEKCVCCARACVSICLCPKCDGSSLPSRLRMFSRQDLDLDSGFCASSACPPYTQEREILCSCIRGIHIDVSKFTTCGMQYDGLTRSHVRIYT